MGSYIQIDSISVDIPQSNRTVAGQCEHFSIRGYVSEIRKKDWKQCWPFPVNESEKQPSLPPLKVPKFRRWDCDSCRQETAAEGFDKNDQRDLNCGSSGCKSDGNCNNAVVNAKIQQVSITDSIIARREIDLNKAIDPSSDSDCVLISDEIENNAEVIGRIADHQIGLENNRNHQVSNVPSPEVCPGLIQEGHTNKTADHEIGLENNGNHQVSSVPSPEVCPGLVQEGRNNDDHEISSENNDNHQVSIVPSPDACPDLIQEEHTNNKGCEGNDVFNVELDTSNLKDMDKSPPDEVRNKWKPISADNQCQEVSSVPPPEVCPGLIQEENTDKRGCEGNEVANGELDSSNLKHMDTSPPKVRNKGKRILADNQNQKVSSVPSPEEGNTSKRGCEGNEVSNGELDTSNLKHMVKSTPRQVRNRGKRIISADNQSQKVLRKSSRASKKAKVVIEEDNVTDDDTSEYVPSDNVDEFSDYSCKKPREVSKGKLDTSNLRHMDKTPPKVRNKGKRILADNQSQRVLRKSRRNSRKATIVIEEDNVTDDDTSEYLPPDNVDDLSDYSCKKPQKMRSMIEVMRETGEPLPEQGDMRLTKRGPGRKRKSRLNKKRTKPADRAENEVQDQEGGAITIEAVPDNRSRGVRGRELLGDAMKGHRHKPEVERSRTVSKKKSKRTQQVDVNHTSSEPHQGQQNEMEGTVDAPNNDHASKTLPSGSIPYASTEKGKDSFPLHAPTTENEHNLSKGKGKMLQADEELDSLSSRKNDELVEDSFELNKITHQLVNRLSRPLRIGEGPEHITNAIPEKGKEVVNNVENSGDTDKDITVKDAELGSIERPYDLTAEEKCENRTEQDYAALEAAEILNNLQGNSQPDLENVSGSLGNSIQNETPQAEVGEEYGIITIEENYMSTTNGFSIGYSFSYFGNQFGRSKRCTIQSPFGVSQSSALHFSSSVDPAHQTPMFNGFIADQCRPHDATSQVQRGSNIGNRILQQEDEAPSTWAPMSSNSAFLRSDDATKKVVCKPMSSNMDMISLGSGSLPKQNKKRDIDLNLPSCIVIDLEELDENTGPGTLSKPSSGHLFSSKHNGMEPPQNHGGYLDLDSNQTTPAMNSLSFERAIKQPAATYNAGVIDQTPKKTFYTGECSTAKFGVGSYKNLGSTNWLASDYYKKSYLSDPSSHYYFRHSPFLGPSSSTQHHGSYHIGPTDFSDPNLTMFGRKGKKMNSSNSFMQNMFRNQFSRPHLGTETPLQHNLGVRGPQETPEPLIRFPENYCRVNQNPADFTDPGPENPFMINGEDLKFKKRNPRKRTGSPTPRGCSQKKRNSKGGPK